MRHFGAFSLNSGLAGAGNSRIIEKAVRALPGRFDKIYVRGDSALYENEAMTWMDERAIALAIPRPTLAGV